MNIAFYDQAMINLIPLLKSVKIASVSKIKNY